MCAVIDPKKRMEMVILVLLKTPRMLINAGFLKAEAINHGIGEQTFDKMIDQLIDRGWVKELFSERTKEVFGYQVTEAGYRGRLRMRRQAESKVLQALRTNEKG